MAPRSSRSQRFVHALFTFGVVLKGIDGALEMAGGAMLYVINGSKIDNFVRILTQHELSEDRHDLIARYLLNTTGHLSASAQSFAAFYLLWHGAIKVLLVTALLLKRPWAYPAAIAAFGLFVAYQLYRYSHTRAPELLVLSALDVLVIVMTGLEFWRLRRSIRVIQSDA